jgi:hypothetical protein
MVGTALLLLFLMKAFKSLDKALAHGYEKIPVPIDQGHKESIFVQFVS